jgi:hypothetical protein
MRHFSGIVLAVVAALAIFFGGGWGYLRLLQVPTANEPRGSLPGGGGSLLHDHRVLFALVALLAVGLLIGLLMAVPWVSPLATGLPGLALLALTALYLTSVHRAVQLIPLRTRPYGLGFEALLFNGVLALVGLVLVIPLFVPSRWRRRTAVPYAGVPDPAQSGLLTSEDTAVTQQGPFFGTQEFPAADSTAQQDPFPPVTNPYPPTQDQQNPYLR